MNTQSKGLAVITGASSGIGAVYADRLARRGYDLLLVARNRERMEKLAKKLAADTQREVGILAADLTKSDDLFRLERILREDSRITLLVNNAGVLGNPSRVEWRRNWNGDGKHSRAYDFRRTLDSSLERLVQHSRAIFFTTQAVEISLPLCPP